MLAYGYKSKDEDDDVMVRLVNEAMDQFSETTASNAFLVDVFPIRGSTVFSVLLELTILCSSPICTRMVPRCCVEKEGFKIPKYFARHAEYTI